MAVSLSDQFEAGLCNATIGQVVADGGIGGYLQRVNVREGRVFPRDYYVGFLFSGLLIVKSHGAIIMSTDRSARVMLRW